MIEESTVVTWLDESGLESESIDLAGARWARIYRGGVFSCLVVHPDVDWNQLVLQLKIDISDDHREILMGLDRDTVDRFLFDLRIALLSRTAGFQLETGEEGEAPLLSMVFSLTMFEDEPSKAGFLRRNHQLQSSALLGVTMTQKLARFREWR